MGNFKREEIEMFCLERLINCYMDTDHENNFFDWYFSSNEAGLRGIFQLCHLMVTAPNWTESGFKRVKTTIESNSRAVNKSLERANFDKILLAVFNGDRRFREPSKEEIDALTLDGVRGVLEKYMRPDNIEVR
jgi:predicted Zn-dependent peptidase